MSVIVMTLALTGASAEPRHAQVAMTPCERFGSDAAVFVGEIGEPTRHTMRAPPDFHPIQITALPVRVERSFRGVAGHPVVYLYPVDPTAAPKAGARHLVSGSFNFNVTNVVSAAMSKPAEEAADDLAFLESVDSSSNTGSISGLLLQGNRFEVRTRKPLSGVTVRFHSAEITAETTTDAKGRYSIRMPEGVVRIEPLLPDHLVGRGTTEVRAGGCTSYTVVAELNGRIRGRVLRPDGSPMTWLVNLLPVDPARTDVERSGRYMKADANGEYEFAALPPGEYLVGVNINRPADNGAPFPATYFPGTVRREEALAISVGEGTVHERIDFMLADAIPRGKLQIRLHDPAGASGAVVCLQDITNPPATPGATYPFEPRAALIIDVLDASRYRLIAHVERPGGHTESDVLELTGRAGHQTVTVTATLPGRRHTSPDVCATIWLPR